MTLEIERFSSTDAAALALARAVAAELTAALAQRPRALLLVSGGRSPLVFFEALRLQPIDWQRIDVSLVDERCVAADDDAANASLVRAHLLHGAAAAARWIGLLPEAEALVGATPIGLKLAKMAAARWQGQSPLSWSWSIAGDLYLAAIFLVSACYLAAGTYNPFIYFRF